jgi:hypothetical protein
MRERRQSPKSGIDSSYLSELQQSHYSYLERLEGPKRLVNAIETPERVAAAVFTAIDEFRGESASSPTSVFGLLAPKVRLALCSLPRPKTQHHQQTPHTRVTQTHCS